MSKRLLVDHVDQVYGMAERLKAFIERNVDVLTLAEANTLNHARSMLDNAHDEMQARVVGGAKVLRLKLVVYKTPFGKKHGELAGKQPHFYMGKWKGETIRLGMAGDVQTARTAVQSYVDSCARFGEYIKVEYEE